MTSYEINLCLKLTGDRQGDIFSIPILIGVMNMSSHEVQSRSLRERFQVAMLSATILRRARPFLLIKWRHEILDLLMRQGLQPVVGDLRRDDMYDVYRTFGIPPYVIHREESWLVTIGDVKYVPVVWIDSNLRRRGRTVERRNRPPSTSEDY